MALPVAYAAAEYRILPRLAVSRAARGGDSALRLLGPFQRIPYIIATYSLPSLTAAFLASDGSAPQVRSLVMPSGIRRPEIARLAALII
jgi:hypothetical protein